MAAGLDPAGFWDLTWREADAVLRGARKRLDREHNERAWSAWHTAGLGRMKRFPDLRKLMVGLPAPRRQTPSEMIAIAERWNRAINQR